jgi:hypothetical protein
MDQQGTRDRTGERLLTLCAWQARSLSFSFPFSLSHSLWLSLALSLTRSVVVFSPISPPFIHGSPARLRCPTILSQNELLRSLPCLGCWQIGMVTIIMNDYPMVKYVLVGLMGLFVLTTKE